MRARPAIQWNALLGQTQATTITTARRRRQPLHVLLPFSTAPEVCLLGSAEAWPPADCLERSSCNFISPS